MVCSPSMRPAPHGQKASLWRGLGRIAVILLALAAMPACATPQAVVPFVQNDFEGALAEAKRSQRLLVVEVWAEWCRECRAMRGDVFADPALAVMRDRFVWLAVDVDDAAARQVFMQRFPTRSIPRVWIIDPETEDAVLDWGTLTTKELCSLLATSEELVAAKKRGDAVAAARLRARLAAVGR